MRKIEEIKADISATAYGTQHQHDAAWLEWFRVVAQGIDPDRLEEICQAEREGRCVVLPCKVGDTVYIRRYSLAQKQNIIIEAHVAAVKVFRTGFQIDCVTHNGAVNKCEWGRQCFATRAEAEAALKEREKE